MLRLFSRKLCHSSAELTERRNLFYFQTSRNFRQRLEPAVPELVKIFRFGLRWFYFLRRHRRPRCLIYAATYHEKTYRRLAAYHNVYPRLLNGRKGEECSENFFKQLSTRMLNEKMAGPGDRVTVLTGISNQDNQWRLNAVHTITMPGRTRRRAVTA